MSDWFLMNSTWGQFILMAIGILLLLNFISSLLGCWHVLFREQPALEQMEKNFLNMKEQGLNLSKKVETLGNNCSMGAEVMRRLNTLYFLKSQNQKVNSESYLPADNLRRKTSILPMMLRHSPAFVLLLGFSGLFGGLSQMSVYLLPILQQSGIESMNQFLESDLSAPLNFVTAVSSFKEGLIMVFTGFLAAFFIYLMAFAWKMVSSQFYSKLEIFTITRLLPVFNPTDTETQMNQLIGQVAHNTNLTNNTVHYLLHASEQISVEYEKLSQLSVQLTNGVSAFLQAQDTLTQSFTALQQLAQNQTPLNNQIAPEQYKLVEALNLHNATISQLSERLHQTELDFWDWLKEIIDLSKQQHLEFKAEIKSITEFTRSNLSNTQSAGNRFDNSTKKFEAALEKLKIILDAFSQSFQEAVQQELVKLDEVNGEIQALNVIVRNIQKEIPSQLLKMTNTLDTTNKLANPAYIDQMARAIAAEAIAVELESFEKEFKRLNSQIAEMEARLAAQKKFEFGNWVQKVLTYFGLGK